MITTEMLAIVTDNAARLTHGMDTVIQYLRRMPGIASEDGSNFTADAGPQMPRSMQRNLAAIICGEEFSVGDTIRVRPQAAGNPASAASLVAPDQVGTITHLRWPNSENLGRLVVQADFGGKNLHFGAQDVVRT
jgi:hypothetical protein